MGFTSWGRPKKTNKREELGVLLSTVQEVAGPLDDETLKKIAGVAGLLGKVAYADMNISGAEQEKIRRVLTDLLGLDPPRVEAIVRLMMAQKVLLFSVEDHLYARMINEVCRSEEKRDILYALFSLAAADDSVSAAEDAALWTVAKSLRLTHRDFIDARKRFAAQLDLLKNRS